MGPFQIQPPAGACGECADGAIARHQQVYATLGARLKTDEVHALSMKTYTPAEWADLPR